MAPIDLYGYLAIYPLPGGLSFVEVRAVDDKTKKQVDFFPLEWSCASDRNLADYIVQGIWNAFGVEVGHPDHHTTSSNLKSLIKHECISKLFAGTVATWPPFNTYESPLSQKVDLE